VGAWGTGIYDNDDAADWSAEVSELGLRAVENALDEVLDADYVEAPDGACALAAADVVARLVSGRGEDSPYSEEVVAWIATNPEPPSAALVAKALQAVQRVGGNDSELAELWAENAAEVAGWRATIADTAQRLNA
jgi:Domain of unknown function (DUF4259)